MLDMLGSAPLCGATCAELDWDVALSQLVITAVIWLVFSACGFVLIWRVRSGRSDFDMPRRKLAEWLHRWQTWAPSWLLRFVLSTCQCIVFGLRTGSKSVYWIDFLVDVVAITFQLPGFMLSFFLNHMFGFRGFSYMISKGLVTCILVGSFTYTTYHAFFMTGRQSWFTLSYFAAFPIRDAWKDFAEARRLDMHAGYWQIVDQLVTMAVIIFVSAMNIMIFENLGDHPSMQGNEQAAWTVLSSMYFMVVTISTVGYGDLVPVTRIGRITFMMSIFAGFLSIMLALNRLAQTISIHGKGSGFYALRARQKHVVVTGNPTAQTVMDFIAELFHPDHAEAAEDLQAVFLFPRGSATLEAIAQHMKDASNTRLVSRVYLLQGSAMELSDLTRACVKEAAAVFVIPDQQCQDAMREDSENIIRMMAIQRYAPDRRIIIQLLKAEHRQLLADSGMQNGPAVRQPSTLAADQFKFELIGKACQVPGFNTFITNLCTTTEMPDDAESKGLPGWQQEYDRGAGNELYELELHSEYATQHAKFSDVVLDVLEQTNSEVYLIGLIEVNKLNGTKRVLVNPGAHYPIKDQMYTSVQTMGIFIASDMEAVKQCPVGWELLQTRERALDEDDKPEVPPGLIRKRRDAGFEDTDLPSAELLHSEGLTGPEQTKARDIVRLAKESKRASLPARVPLKKLAKGGHVLILCVGADSDLHLGVEHFVAPLRAQYFERPVLIMAPDAPRDWHTVVNHKDVYYVKGSPLSVFDLQLANISEACAVFICHAGSAIFPQQWMADADVICCTRLVESQLQSSSKTPVIAELTFSANHAFIPLLNTETGYLHEEDEQEGRTLQNLAAEMPFYRQPRFASGQLYVGSTITSVLVNAHFNPSLTELVSTLIGSNVVMVSVTPVWVGRPYNEFFDDLLWSQQLLAVGIFRLAVSDDEKNITAAGGVPCLEGVGRKQLTYLYTAPPGKETAMLATDRVICYGVSEYVDSATALGRDTDEDEAPGTTMQTLSID